MAAMLKAAVLRGVNADLKAMEDRLPGVSSSGLAEAARALARELGAPDNSATSKALCARALRETLDRLADMLPPENGRDGIDQLAVERARRRARVA